MNDLPKEHISFSQISMFNKCPQQYAYRYVEGFKSPPPWTMFSGRIGHNTLQYNNESKMETGEDVGFKTLTEYFHNSWEENEEEEERIVYGDYKPDRAKTIALSPLQEYFAKGGHRYDIPLAVEKMFNIILADNIIVNGYLDVIFLTPDDKTNIIDYKFSKKRPNIGMIFNSLQLSIYGLSQHAQTGEYPDNLMFDYLIHTKVPQYLSFPIQRDEKMYRRAYNDIVNTVDNIKHMYKAGTWYRNCNGYHCSPISCGYWKKCKPGETKPYFDFVNKYTTKRK